MILVFYLGEIYVFKVYGTYVSVALCVVVYHHIGDVG